MAESTITSEIILCIPGTWSDRSNLLEQIIRCSQGYMFLGRILSHMESRYTFELQYAPRDERMLSAFMAASPHWVNTPELARIGEHASVVYLIGAGGSEKNVQAIMLAASALLKSGGLGVKVETTGMAHSPHGWRKMSDEFNPYSAHRAFVLILTGSDVYSCGMHNLGMKDAIVDCDDAADAVELIRTFTSYMVGENPVIRAGQTFSVAPDAPFYKIMEDPGASYENDSLFANPYGFWRLVPR